MSDAKVTATLKMPRVVGELFGRIYGISLADLSADEKLWAEIKKVFGEFDPYEQEPFEDNLKGEMPANPVNGEIGTIGFRIEPTHWEQDDWEDAFLQMEFLLEFDTASVSEDSGYYEWQEYCPSETEDCWQGLYWNDLNTEPSVVYEIDVVLGD